VGRISNFSHRPSNLQKNDVDWFGKLTTSDLSTRGVRPLNRSSVVPEHKMHLAG